MAIKTKMIMICTKTHNMYMFPCTTKWSEMTIDDNIRRWLKFVVLVVAVLLASLILYIATGISETKIFGDFSTLALAPNSNISALDPESDAMLDITLKKASMENKTVILTTINSAWASSVVELFLEGFHKGIGTTELIDHLIIVCLDQESLHICNNSHPHCFGLRTEGVDFSGPKAFMSDGYLLMMWRRIYFLQLVLEKGYNFVFTDADIVWFRNPFDKFYQGVDFQIACDQYYGNPKSTNNMPNGGFKYVKANQRSIAFYKFWHASREHYPGQHDQDVLNKIKSHKYISEIGLEMRFLSTEYFGGLCEPSMDLNKVYTMHTNCCTDLDSKLHDMRVMLEDWKRFFSMSREKKESRPWTWSLLQMLCM